MGRTNSLSAERDLTSRIMAAKIVLVLALSACALADPSYYGYGGYGRGYGGTSYEYRSPQGLGKREAEPAYGYGGSYQRVTRLDGIDRQFTTYGVRTSGYGASVDEPKFGRLGKREAEPGYATDTAAALLPTLMASPTPTGLPRVLARGRLSPAMVMVDPELLTIPMVAPLMNTGLLRVLARGRRSLAMATMVLPSLPTLVAIPTPTGPPRGSGARGRPSPATAAIASRT